MQGRNICFTTLYLLVLVSVLSSSISLTFLPSSCSLTMRFFQTRIFLFALSSSAFVINEHILPFQTSIPASISDAEPPLPTEGPKVEELRVRDEQKILLAAKDNICGYINGSSGNFSPIASSIPHPIPFPPRPC